MRGKDAMDNQNKEGRCTVYPPSVLVMADGCWKALKLKRWLENKGCQAYETDTTSEDAEHLDQKYFDLIVLDVDTSDITKSKAYNKLKSIYQRLKSTPELLGPLVVMLTSQVNQSFSSKTLGPVYFIPKGRGARTTLLQIIEQTHYLTCRYN